MEEYKIKCGFWTGFLAAAFISISVFFYMIWTQAIIPKHHITYEINKTIE